jgi:putative ABC transport system permease protein
VNANLTTAAGLALDSIRAHKLRSFLTLLGVIIGVASVVLVGAAIEGLGVYAEGITAKAFGTDSFLLAQIASVGRLSRKELVEKQRYNKRLQPDDVRYLREATGESLIYSAFAQRIEDVKGDNQTFEGAQIIGASYTLPEIREIPIEDGRFYSEAEERMRRPVAVIGYDIWNTLFPGGSPIGRKIRIKGIEFTVVGLMERQGSSFGRSLDTPVYLPMTWFYTIYGSQRGTAVFGKARESSGLGFEEALDTARAALRARFHTMPGKADRFDTLTPDSVRSFVDQILGVIAAVVVPVTSISLVVGGIVIMNIMLVSVTERTREIGVRKSLGARQRDILLQFLTESVMLSMAGGMIGLVLAVVLTEVLSAAMGATMRVTWPYVLLAMFVSTAVGILSGIYPARRAAKLDPVVALRAE